MIELVDIGSKVEAGSYLLHSRFRQALVFVREPDGALVSVVDESKSAGPAHIVVRGLDLSSMRSLRVAAHSVVLGRATLPIQRRSGWRVQPAVFNAAGLDRNLGALKKALLAGASTRGIVFLLCESADCATLSTFETEVVQRLRAGVARLVAGDMRGAAEIHGVGFGLTPSGDDFLAGFLLGLYALEAAGGGCSTAKRQTIHEMATTGNRFSASLLRNASEGRCIEPAWSLIQALFDDTETVVVHHARRLATVGASSGVDLATGVYFALSTRGPGAPA